MLKGDTIYDELTLCYTCYRAIIALDWPKLLEMKQ